MSQEQTTPPAFPDARSKNLRSRKTLILIGIGGALAFACASWLIGNGIAQIDGRNGTKRIDGLTPMFLVGLLIVGFAFGLVWNLKFWRTIDEAARRAHLDAFYWGGSISWMVIAPISVLPMKINGFHLPFIETLDMSASHIFGLGIWATIMVTLIGYGVAWLIWWSTKR